MKKKFEVIQIKNIPTTNFVMNPVELKEYIDFEVKRVYYIDNITGATSQHCHFEEVEMFIMIQGEATAIIDQGNGKEEIHMGGPSTAIYVGSYVWHGFKDFSEDAILFALSSTNYKSE